MYDNKFKYYLNVLNYYVIGIYVDIKPYTHYCCLVLSFWPKIRQSVKIATFQFQFEVINIDPIKKIVKCNFIEHFVSYIFSFK